MINYEFFVLYLYSKLVYKAQQLIFSFLQSGESE